VQAGLLAACTFAGFYPAYRWALVRKEFWFKKKHTKIKVMTINILD
jgi:hypothetical protein